MTNQLRLDAIAGTAPLQSKPIVWWMGFWRTTPDDWAERRFIEKHGHKPRAFVRDGAILKVGPIEEGR